jgi:GT2 family glycosyltransferase
MKDISDDTNSKLLSIIILNWNGKQLMEHFLPSVIKYTPQAIANIIVADNGSTDDSLSFLKTAFPSVQIISFDTNWGFAEGYNKAIEHIQTKYTVLLNSDIEVTEGWFTAPLQALEGDESIAGVQPKILSQKEKDYFEYAGAAGGYLDKYGYPFCRGRILHIVEQDKGQYDTDTDILWASGACLFIRTDLYKAAGGLDSIFFAHQEEIDLCWRLRSRGYRIRCIPASVVYHVGGGTLKAENPRKTFLNFRNNLLMLYKNLPEIELKKVMRLRFWFDYIAAAKFLLTGHPQNARAVYNARKNFHQLLPEYTSVRKENLSKMTLDEIPELMTKSLIFLFYLKGKKTFTAILPFFRKQK